MTANKSDPGVWAEQGLVECVPNFNCSEAQSESLRRLALKQPGITVLGLEHDCDHNRAVATFVGAPEAVLRAMKKLARFAVSEFDLASVPGVHPRTGVVDVVPFVPVRGCSMADCVELARDFGAWAGSELRVPCFFYEAACSKPEFENLAEVRRAIKSKLAAEVAQGLEADCGPETRHESAGVMIIGAREFLVAFNVNLASQDLKLAKRIARRIRERDGGLPGVKALGLRLKSRDQVQVSMNLVALEKTGPLTAYEAVKALAVEKGVEVAGAELIGFMPQKCVTTDLAKHMSLESPLGPRILETAIEVKRQRTSDLESMTTKIASLEPAPGGGTTAAWSLSMAAATVLKALRFSREHLGEADWLTGAETELEGVVSRAIEVGHEDSEAFGALMSAYRMPKSTKEQKLARKAALNEGRDACVHASDAIIAGCLTVINVGQRLINEGNKNLINDAALGTMTAATAAQGAIWNALANVSKKSSRRAEWVEQLKEFARVQAQVAQIMTP